MRLLQLHHNAAAEDIEVTEGGHEMPKSNDLKPPKAFRDAGRPADAELAEALLRIIAIGVAGGIATIAGAKKFGEGLQNMQEEAAARLEEERAAYKRAVKAAAANEFEVEYESMAAEMPDYALGLTPAPLDDQPEIEF